MDLCQSSEGARHTPTPRWRSFDAYPSSAAAVDEHAMPAIVMRAREEAQCRLALARLGYLRVRSAYARHKRQGKDTFVGLDHKFLTPTMEFVGNWLRDERQQILARARWPFLIAMLGTIIAGSAFLAVVNGLG